MKSRSSPTGQRIHLALLLLAVSAGPVLASPAPSGPTIDLRYRHETVDDGAFDRDAQADTLRLRLGYRWVFSPSWQVYGEGEHTEALFGERYNSTANGRTQYPVVADPEADQINQAWLRYGRGGFTATLGRQQVMLDNQRHFGNVGWRQNEQTFDALSASLRIGNSGTLLRYHYLDRALRVFGQQNPNPLLREYSLDGHLFNLERPMPLGALTAYAYLVENRDVAILSTRTLGARWTGSKAFGALGFDWTAEWATQSSYANNPQSQRAQYRHIEPSLQVAGITFKLGWEVLGGNGRYGFGTPYATLHAFNGWADRFANTPADGLDDRYLAVGGRFRGAAWSIGWHDFRADHGHANYGHELDALLTYPFGARWKGLLKLADYRSDGFAADTRKTWASIEYRY
jgi:hypothetical protein